MQELAVVIQYRSGLLQKLGKNRGQAMAGFRYKANQGDVIFAEIGPAISHLTAPIQGTGNQSALVGSRRRQQVAKGSVGRAGSIVNISGHTYIGWSALFKQRIA